MQLVWCAAGFIEIIVFGNIGSRSLQAVIEIKIPLKKKNEAAEFFRDGITPVKTTSQAPYVSHSCYESLPLSGLNSPANPVFARDG
jgi:hypothetical protein